MPQFNIPENRERALFNLPLDKWYSLWIFPLIPRYAYREKSEHSEQGWTFKWLFFTAWSLSHFSFELSIVADTHWGIGIVGILPYLRWVFAIPCTYKVNVFFHNYFSLTPKPKIRKWLHE